MMTPSFRLALPMLTLAALTVTPAGAQMPNGPTVSGSGTAVLKKDAQLIRMQLEVQAKGKDLKEALTRLKERREAASKKLGELGAVADSVRYDDVRILPAENQSEQRNRMQRMVEARMRGEKTSSKEAARKAPVKVAVTLKAEWPLKGESVEDRLLATAELEDKIREADLAGKQAMEALTPEEKEEAEEAAGEEPQMYYSGDEGPEPGEPVFIYVAKLTAEERTKLLADAFQKAKENALELAKAAGAEIGSLQSLSGGGRDLPDYGTYSMYGSQYSLFAYQLMQRVRGEQDQGDDEAIGVELGQVTTRMQITAAFALK